MESQGCTPAANHVVLSSARIAGHVANGRIPPTRELFLLSAAIVEGMRQGDAHAVALGLDAVAGLLDSLPWEAPWEGCRGHLTAAMEFSWLLREQTSPLRSHLTEPYARTGSHTSSSSGIGHFGMS